MLAELHILYQAYQEVEDVLTYIETLMQMERKSTKLSLSNSLNISRFTKNVIFERDRLNRRSQLKEESVEQCITSMYTLAETREYGDL